MRKPVRGTRLTQTPGLFLSWGTKGRHGCRWDKVIARSQRVRLEERGWRKFLDIFSECESNVVIKAVMRKIMRVANKELRLRFGRTRLAKIPGHFFRV
jgi:hypothetical protein